MGGIPLTTASFKPFLSLYLYSSSKVVKRKKTVPFPSFLEKNSGLSGWATALQAPTLLLISRSAKVTTWFLFGHLVYDFTKHVLSHMCWSCSLWGSYCSRERSSHQCSIESKLWKLRRKQWWNGSCNFFVSSTSEEAEIWKCSILVLTSAP